MKEQLKSEFTRAFKSKMLYICLLIGSIITISQFIIEVLPSARDPLAFFTGRYDSYPITVFQKWIGQNAISPFSLTYRTILPILATLPYALTYLSDVKSGYIKNIFSRTKRINYLVAKYVVIFVTAGIVVVIPYILNLYATALVLPSLTPVCNGYFTVRAICMMENLFYSKTYLYIAVYLFIYFIYAGVFASVALAVVRWVDNIFLVSIVPFIVFYITRIISPYFRHIAWLGVIDATSVLNMCQTTAVKWMAVLLIPVLVGGISAGIYFINGVKSDAF